MAEKWISVSGYFDPLHIGHLEYLEKAKKLGDRLVVIVNNDHQAQLKKGRSFMPENERVQIIRSLKVVDRVVLSVDKDRTVCETLRTMNPKPDAFCNGGDQNNQSIPETSVCIERGIDLIDGLGDKIQSSSWLINKCKKKPDDESKTDCVKTNDAQGGDNEQEANGEQGANDAQDPKVISTHGEI